MKRFLKWTLIITGGSLVLVVAAVTLFITLVDVHQLQSRFETQLARTTGRSVSLGDDLRLSLFPWMGVSFSDLRIGNPPGFTENEFLAADAFEVGVRLFPLFTGNLQVDRFVLKSPRLSLITNKDRRTNWSKILPPSKAPAPSASQQDGNLPDVFRIKTFRADRLSIEDGTLFWIDHAEKTRRKISKINLSCKNISLHRPFDVALDCLADTHPLALKGTIGPLRKIREAQALEVDVTLTALKQLNVHVKGRIDNIPKNPTCKLALNIAPFSPRSLFSALRIAAPFLNTGPATFAHLALAVNAAGNPKEIHLNDGRLTLDETRFNFSMDMRNTTRPELRFDIEAGRIDLNRYLPPPNSDLPKSSKTEFDFEPLKRFTVDGRLRAEKVLMATTELENIKLQVNCRDGRLALKLDRMDLFGGRAGGTGSLDVTRDIPAFKINAAVSQIRSELASDAFLKKRPIQGPLGLAANISAAGLTMPDLTRSLNGTVSARGKNLTLLRFALDDILKEYEDTQRFGFLDIGSFFILGPFGPLLTRSYEQVGAAAAFKEGKSLIKNLNSDWKISQGVASTKDVAFATAKNRIAVRGKVNLVTKRFDNLEVALLDESGCARFSQTLNGPITNPEIAKADFVAKHIIAPITSLFTRTKKLLSKSRCKPFYKGIVAHPPK